MNENTAEVLKHIADKLDVPVAQLWAGLVAYAPFWFYHYIAIVVVGVLIGSALLTVSIKTYGKNIGDGMVCAMAGVFGTSMLTATLFYGAVELGYALAARAAPEAWAAQHVLRMLDRR